MSKPITRPCGTEAAYQRHRAAGETACAACLRAHSAYYKDYQAARARALTRLSHEYRKRFGTLMVEEWRPAGGR